MLKFLRKYNKALLIFFGVFLMIAFLVPQAINQFRDDAGHVLMTIDGHKVTAKDAQRSQHVLGAVNRLTFGQFPAAVGIESREVDHWLLAREAARRGGFFGGVNDGATIITPAAQIAVVSSLNEQQRFMMQFDRNALQQVQQRVEMLANSATAGRANVAAESGLLERELDEGLAATGGMSRMRQAYIMAPRLSQNRLIHKARENLDEAQMQLLFIGVDPTGAGAPEPTEEAIKAHYEKYRDKPAFVAGGPADQSTFGYLRPRRYKLEFLTLDRAAIEKAVRVSPIEVQKRLMTDAMKEETDPAKRRAAVETTIRQEITAKVLSEATLAYRAEVLAATRTLGDDGFYRIVTTEWTATRPRLDAVAQRIVTKVKEQTGVDMPLPTITVLDRDWLTDADVQRIPGLGRSLLPRGNDAAALSDILPAMKELIPAGLPRPEVVIQAGVPFAEPLEDFSRNRYFLTILDARNASPPESLDEVRTQVVIDCKRAEAYEKLTAQLSGFETLAIAQGLDALQEQVKTIPGLTADLRSGVTVRGNAASPRDSAANTEEFTKAAKAKMTVLDPTVPLDRAPPPDLLVAVPVPSRLGLAVGKFTSYTPATLERFRQEAGRMATTYSAEMIKDREALFNRDRLMKHLNAEYPGRVMKEKEEDKTTGSATPAGAAPAAGK